MKKLLAFLLVMTMMLTTVPMTVFAEEESATEETQKQEVKNEEQVETEEDKKEEPSEEPQQGTDAETEPADSDDTPEEEPAEDPVEEPEEETTEESNAECAVKIRETDFAEGKLSVVYTVDGSKVTDDINYEWKHEGESEVLSYDRTYICSEDDLDKTLVCKVTDPVNGSFEAKTKVYQINVSVNDNTMGSVSPCGTIYAISGSAPEFKIECAEGYAIKSLAIDKIEIEPASYYTFDSVNKDHKLEVTFTEALYTVKWVNCDEKNTVLETDENVEYGTTPEYNGGDYGKPVYPGVKEDGYIYVFDDWDPEVVPVSGDNTEHIVYTAAYKKYKVSKGYNLFAVHYMLYSGEGKTEEIGSAFYYTVKKVGDVVEAENYKKTFKNYTFIGASAPELVVADDNRDPRKLENNCIYLYYMQNDSCYQGRAKLDSNGSVLVGDEVSCEYTAKSGTDAGTVYYTWYSVGSDGELEKQGKKSQTSECATKDSETGKWLICEVTDSGNSRGAFSNAVFVRGAESTLSLEETDFTSEEVSAVYTPAEGTTTGELTYQWERRESKDDTDGEIIGTGTNYTLQAEDVGKVVYCKVTAEEGTSGSAEQAVSVYTITASVNDEALGTITPSGEIYAIEGSMPSFEVKPVQGYDVQKFTVDETEVEAANIYTFEAVESSHTITALLAQGLLTVEWVNYNCSSSNPVRETLQTDTDVEAGTVPEYKGAKPVYTSETQVPDGFIYFFYQWSPTVSAITENTTYETEYRKSPTKDCTDSSYAAKTKYELLAVHYMVYDGQDNDTELDNQFTYDPKQFSSTVAASKYAKDISGYEYLYPSSESIKIVSDANRVENLKNNILYMYYIPVDGLAVLNTDESYVPSGTELVCEYTGSCGATYTWYTVDENGVCSKVGTGDRYVPASSDIGCRLYCATQPEDGSGVSNTKPIRVRDDKGTVTINQNNAVSGKVTAEYTQAEGTVAGEVTYTWYRCVDTSTGTQEEEIGTYNSNTYTLQAADKGKLIFCRVSDSGASGGAKSDYVRVYGISAAKSGNGTITAKSGSNTYTQTAEHVYYVIEGSSIQFTFTPTSSLYKVSALKVGVAGESMTTEKTASSRSFNNIEDSYNLKVEFAYIYADGGTATAGDGSEETAGDDEAADENSDGGILYPDETMMEIPEEYSEPAQTPGTTNKVTYVTVDGASHYALVYVPAGYDENTQYNILYLLHGENETPEAILGTQEEPSILKLMLDHMIEEGIIEPMLIAAPSLYPDDYDPETVTVEELVEAFPNDWSTCIIPAIETKYSTYAGKDVSEEKLVATRDHRAFGGYGAGAAATWYAFMNDMQYTSTFIPVSEDCWLLGRNSDLYVHVDADAITETDVTEVLGDVESDENVVAETTAEAIPSVSMSNYSEEVKTRYSTLATALSTALFNTDYWTEDFFIYAMTGTLDEAGERETALIAAMREMDDTPFVFSSERDYGNISYRVKEGAAYDSSLLGLYLYNTLQNMWPVVDDTLVSEDAAETDDGSFEYGDSEDAMYPEDAEPVGDTDGLLDTLPKI